MSNIDNTNQQMTKIFLVHKTIEMMPEVSSCARTASTELAPEETIVVTREKENPEFCLHKHSQTDSRLHQDPQDMSPMGCVQKKLKVVSRKHA